MLTNTKETMMDSERATDLLKVAFTYGPAMDDRAAEFFGTNVDLYADGRVEIGNEAATPGEAIRLAEHFQDEGRS